MSSIFGPHPVPPGVIDRLRAMPKIELHVHLEGATDAATVWELARRNQVTLPVQTLEEWQALYVFRDFNHFIEIYQMAAACMQTPEDFLFMVERFAAQQARQHVRYCEVFLSASLMVDKFPTAAILAALAEGIRRSEADHGVRLRFIPDIARHTPETGRRVLDFALQGHAAGVCLGLGLGGKEVGFPPELFADVFAEARRQGLHVVAHAGETDGPASIWGAVRSLQVERIGHGVRAVDDAALIEHLQWTRLPLEVSPYSNYRLHVTPPDQPHPIHTLWQRGIVVTVNTDDPPMFSTDLTGEYVLLARQGMPWETLWQLNQNALAVSFLPDPLKAHYQAEWQAFAAALPPLD